MASVCSINEFVIAPTTTPGVYWYINKGAEGNGYPFQKYYGSIPDFYELNQGSVIKIGEAFSQVAITTKAAQGASLPIVNTLLYSTSGDMYNKLLSAKVSGNNLVVVMYALTAKEITTYSFPLQTQTNDSPAITITPCIQDYQVEDNVILDSWCDGFTLNEVITEGGTITLRQTPNSVTCGYSSPEAPFIFSEQKLIEYRKCVLLNPILFVWKNTLGGWDYWLFQVNQTQHIDTVSLGYFQKNYTKISDISNPQSEVGKQVTTRMILGADDLTIQQVQGLKGLLASNKVYILNKDGSVNREVILLPGTFLIQDTSDSLHSLEFEIQDVAINTITN